MWVPDFLRGFCWCAGTVFFWPLMTPVDFAAPIPFFASNNQGTQANPHIGKGDIYPHPT